MDKVKCLKNRWFPETHERKMGAVAVGVSMEQETGQWAGVSGKINEAPALQTLDLHILLTPMIRELILLCTSEAPSKD